MLVNRRHVLQIPYCCLLWRTGCPSGNTSSRTSLSYVQSYPEGFDRYAVFVNVERAAALENSTPPGLVDPLSAPHIKQKITIENLKSILRELGVRRVTSIC